MDGPLQHDKSLWDSTTESLRRPGGRMRPPPTGRELFIIACFQSLTLNWAGTLIGTRRKYL